MSELKIPPRDAIGTIRFAPEETMCEDLLQSAQVADLLEKAKERMASEAQSRRRMLASSLRVNARMMPRLIRIVDTARRIVHLDEMPVETYVRCDSAPNACCMRHGDGPFYLMINSGLVEKLDPHEMLFVIGHEFGHALYGHHRLPSMGALQALEVPRRLALRMLAWSRRAELSADRVGLLCCQSLRVAAHSFLKLSCGLTGEHVQFNLDDYLLQANDFQALSTSEPDSRDLFTSHPFSPLRVIALQRFWNSEIFARLLGRSDGERSNGDVESQINELLSHMEPDTTGEDETGLQTCLLWGSFWVALADGTLDPQEVTAISRAFDSPQAAERANAALSETPDPLGHARQRCLEAVAQCQSAPMPQRQGLIQQLIVVAQADNRVTPEERRVLEEISQALGVDSIFIEQILLMFT